MKHSGFRSTQLVSSPQVWQRLGLVLAGMSTALLQLGQPVLAGDPFRPDNPHDISDTSEQVFYAMFRDGNYVEARAYLENADADAASDPMFHALEAAFHYLDEDWSGMQASAAETRQAAANLAASDELRSHLYEAVGIFLEGAHVLQTEGIAQGTPKALSMLQQVFAQMDAAERLDPADPELSLLKGFMDLLLAVNLPFANPEKAIERLANYGYPDYVAYRGLALGYRDLDRNDEAIAAIDRALEGAPDNPDLLYLKGQILVRMGYESDGEDYLTEALSYADQLPEATAIQIAIEQCRVRNEDQCTARANQEYGSRGDS